MNDCAVLAALLRDHKSELLEHWRRRTRDGVKAAQPLDLPTLDDHVPTIVDSVIAFLQRDGSCDAIPPAVTPGAPTHGVTRLREGYDPAEVVAELSMLRACTFEIAESHGLLPAGCVLRAVNNAYDRVIGDAMASYSAAMNNAIQRHQAEHLSFIAHDLRSPLGAIALAVEALVRSGPPDDTEAIAPRLLRNLSRNVTQLTRLVDDVLESNMPAVIGTQSQALLRATRLNLRSLVEGLGSNLETQAIESGTEFRIDIPAGLEIEADAALLGRALQNLLANAIEYAAPGVVEVWAARQGDAVHCRIRDHGGGIPDAPSDRARKGTETSGSAAAAVGRGVSTPTHHGLGLLIARRFIEAHGGRLQLESGSDGTTIEIELPAKLP